MYQMKHIDPQASAAFFQMSIEKKLYALFGQFTFEQLEEYIKKLYAPNFGKEGVYSYFCKLCNKTWNFKLKEDRQFFERFHKATGCSFETQHDEETGKTSTIRSDDVISKTAQTVFNKIATYKVTTAAINGDIPVVTSELEVGEGQFDGAEKNDIKEEVFSVPEIEDAQIVEEIVTLK